MDADEAVTVRIKVPRGVAGNVAIVVSLLLSIMLLIVTVYSAAKAYRMRGAFTEFQTVIDKSGLP